MIGRRQLGRRAISSKVKMKIFNDVVLCVLLYGATEWAITRTEAKRLAASNMGKLRTIADLSLDKLTQNE